MGDPLKTFVSLAFRRSGGGAWPLMAATPAMWRCWRRLVGAGEMKSGTEIARAEGLLPFSLVTTELMRLACSYLTSSSCR